MSVLLHAGHSVQAAGPDFVQLAAFVLWEARHSLRGVASIARWRAVA